MAEPRYLTVREAAAAMQVREEHIRRLVRSGALAAARTGPGRRSHFRLLQKDIEEMMMRGAGSRENRRGR